MKLFWWCLLGPGLGHYCVKHHQRAGGRGGRGLSVLPDNYVPACPPFLWRCNLGGGDSYGGGEEQMLVEDQVTWCKSVRIHFFQKTMVDRLKMCHELKQIFFCKYQL